MTELPILCLVRDLLFYSKIRAAAEGAGVVLKSIRDAEKLSNEIGIGLIVDLNQAGALDAAVAWRERTGKSVVGFVSHVDTETISSARVSGVDQIFARSQFERNLSVILVDFLDKKAGG